MKATIEDDDVGASGRMAGQPQGHFHGFRSGVAEGDGIEALWHFCHQFLGQIQHGLVGHCGVLGMDEFTHLFLGGCHYGWVAVASGRDTYAGGEVQVAFTVGGSQPAAFAALGADRARLFQQGGKVAHARLLSLCWRA